MAMTHKICRVCGSEFDTNRGSVICDACRHRTCVVCGKPFILKSPFTAVTCSKRCSCKHRADTGEAKDVSERTKKTLIERYGVSNPGLVSGPRKPKICKLCGKEFIPETYRQVYCKDKHYRPCPVCGKPVEVKAAYEPAHTCSSECRTKLIQQTCSEKYGNPCVLNSEYGIEQRKKTCTEKYGADSYSKTDEYQERKKKTMIERYGVEHALQSLEILERMQNTNIQRYGGISPMCSPEVREKSRRTFQERYGGIGLGSPITSKKIRDTLISMYGTDVVTRVPHIMFKIKHTNLMRYGHFSPNANPKVQRKCRATMLKKYGVEFIMRDKSKLREIREKSERTMLERYGVTNPSKSPELLQKISDTCEEMYGVPWYCLTSKCSDSNKHTRISKINQKFSEVLDSFGLEHELEFYVGRKSYDFRIGGILVEIDPTITHNSEKSIFSGGKPLTSDYHFMKTKIAMENGFRCIHVFDWDCVDRIMSLLLPKNVIYARKCELRRIDKKTANIFTDANHIQGSCRGQILNYGLYFNDELVEVMTFGEPRYNRNYDYELLRLCSKSDVRVVGGASKLFHAFISEHGDKSVISYCDISKFSGDVYTAIGMTLHSLTKPAKIWSKESEYITDNLLRQRGFDQLFGTDYGKGTSNEQLMLDAGWLPVYDCGQAVYTYMPNTMT